MEAMEARPKLAAWIASQEKDHYWAAALIGCSGEYVRRLCLPLSDPRRSLPSMRIRRQIAEATAGAVAITDWPPVVLAVAA